MLTETLRNTAVLVIDFIVAFNHSLRNLAIKVFVLLAVDINRLAELMFRIIIAFVIRSVDVRI